jgi:hypothetical protein
LLRKECTSFDLGQSDQKIGKKIAQFLKKVAKTVAKPKKNQQNVFIKAQFESPKQ